MNNSTTSNVINRVLGAIDFAWAQGAVSDAQRAQLGAIDAVFFVLFRRPVKIIICSAAPGREAIVIDSSIAHSSRRGTLHHSEHPTSQAKSSSSCNT